MTTYGTIQTSPSPASRPVNLEYISRAKERLEAGLGTRRPWQEMFELGLFDLPRSLAEAAARVRANAAYFRMNYAVAVLPILFLSLLWHPVSLIVLIAVMAAWLYLYFLRDEPLVVGGRMVNDRTVLIGLSVATVVVLLLTGATGNIFSAVALGVVAVVIHGALRRTDDLAIDQEAAGGLLRSSHGGQSSSS